MKERTLINRYHQTQERPKPAVEQRVKVMDTLDKKMQTALEREDLSAEERLKLYDQSFTRYLNKGNNKITELRTILQRESQSTTGKLWKPLWPWLCTGISKEMVGWIRF